MTVGERLKQARKAAGFKTAKAFAEEMLEPKQKATYYTHESGQRSVRVQTATLYAELMGTTPEAILFGEEKQVTMDTKRYILDSLEQYYQGQIAKHKANISVLFNNHVGLAEHPDIIETLDSQLGLLADYDEKLEMLHKHFYRQKVDPAGPPDNTG